MSKDNNLRLLGSPVNLMYRGKKKDDKKNNRSRPRSAFSTFPSAQDSQERYRRPFSAGSKEPLPSTRSFLNTLNIELQQQPYNNTPNNVKVLPPTTHLLGDTKNYNQNHRIHRDECSNASDYGSEDTFISLGTKIKARAQSPKSKNFKNLLKYKNPTRKTKKVMENCEKNCNEYGLEVKIMERDKALGKNSLNEKCKSPEFFNSNSYSSYFLPLESDHPELAGRVSFGLKNDVLTSIDTYSRRLSVTKQLSLVEEESTQDIESPSQNVSSLSPENSLEEVPDEKNNHPYDAGIKTYNAFYDDFQRDKQYRNQSKGASSKDSGYTDSGTNEESGGQESSLPSRILNKTTNLRDAPKSLQYDFDKSNLANSKTYPSDKAKERWSEPLNHSRLLYKDFFLRKEGHIATAPQNSPVKNEDIPGTSQVGPSKTQLEYPSYLLNSNTKAYTSKVIEDYKKEIAAINNLHELTLKDIQTDAISPTPLDIDALFEPNVENQAVSDKTEMSEDKPPTDINNVTTKELINNYLKVKEDYSKSFQKCNKKNINEAGPSKSPWGKVAKTTPTKQQQSVIPKKTVEKNIFTLKSPLSARIDSVQNDKDVESWISLSAPSPRGQDVQTSPVTTIQETTEEQHTEVIQNSVLEEIKPKELDNNSTVLDIYSMLKEIESFGENPVQVETPAPEVKPERSVTPKDNFMEIFEFLEKVEQSANNALSVVTNTTPQNIPKLEVLLKLPTTELAQRLGTASLQLEERSCCIALLQESLANHKEQMINKVSNLEKQSSRNIARVKQECEEAIKRHQAFIDQLINDKKTLNHRIEQLVDERRTAEERWRRSAQGLEERYKLELRNQHDKMAAAQQVARQRWVRQKAEKIKELTVKGLEGELREMAERQQKDIADIKMAHAEQIGRMQSQHAVDLEETRRRMEEENQAMLVKERQMASARLEKQILDLEATYQEQRTRLIAEMRAENERVAAGLAQKEQNSKADIELWKQEQEQMIAAKREEIEKEIKAQKDILQKQIQETRRELESEFERYKREYECEQQALLKKKATEIALQHKLERDREIEKAIESMETEAQNGRKEMQEALRRNKEHYEAELRELAETEQCTLKRYQEAQARFRQTEDRCAELEVSISQLETRNKILTEKNIQMERQIEEIRTTCEGAWRTKLEDMQKNTEDMKKTHDEHMHQLYAKVKVAVARKDSAIQALTRESAKYQEKITLLEQRLQQQRKDFLKQK